MAARKRRPSAGSGGTRIKSAVYSGDLAPDVVELLRSMPGDASRYVDEAVRDLRASEERAAKRQRK